MIPILPTHASAMATADAKEEVERIAREVLTNPVIEEYTYRLEE
jgi:phosphoribosylformylglycinamidine (FGAM) synthase PurS component